MLPVIFTSATAQVSQSLLNAKLELAFKQIPKPCDRTGASDSSPIRNYPNIVKVLGVCFDVQYHEQSVAPVLVFEKATHDDLASFMVTEKGCWLSVTNRLTIIVDIAAALSITHSAGIIHGDVKPENILVYEEDGAIIPRLAELGFSSVSSQNPDDKTILVLRRKLDAVLRFLMRKEQWDEPHSITHLEHCLNYMLKPDPKERTPSLRALLAALDPDGPRDRLGLVLQDRGKLTDAEGLYRQALGIAEATGQSNNIELLTTMHNLASVLYEQGKSPTALSMFKEWYAEIGELAKAINCHRRVVDRLEASSATSTEAYSSALIQVATVLQRQGRYEQAEKYALAAYQTANEVLKPDTLPTLAILQTYASICPHTGRFESARELLHRVLDGRIRTLTSNHVQIAESLDALTEFYSEVEQFETAVNYGRQALSVQKELQGVDHPNTWTSASNLSRALCGASSPSRVESLAEAESLATEAWQRSKAFFGEDHYTTGQMMWRVAILKREQGAFAEAKALFQQVYELLVIVFDEDNPEVKECCYNLENLESY
ncbi:putative Kinase-like protein [Seiridium unicorne]|uniref:Kinase-like protein n=1 Tax=Seiridium unicorne TaxID=138068 RepID=A0ABR2VER7_9PEZI